MRFYLLLGLFAVANPIFEHQAEQPIRTTICAIKGSPSIFNGRLVEVSPKRTLFATPRHPYTRMLLDAIPQMHATGRDRTPVQGEVPNPLAPPSGCAFNPRCPFANERCRVERPKLLTIDSVQVACHAVEEGRL